MAGKIYYRINQNIRAGTLRVIDEKGKQIGILALSEALKKAQEEGVDVVEIAPGANPPVAKLIDYKKFQYQEEKRRRKEKKGRGGETKGIRLTPFIAEGDLEVRVRRTKEFLGEGNKVRVEVRFKGRQLEKRNIGYELLKKFSERLVDFAKIEQEPKWFGRSLIATLSPVKKGSQKNEKEKNEKQEDENQEISQSPVQDNGNR